MLLAERSAKGKTPSPGLNRVFFPQKYYVFFKAANQLKIIKIYNFFRFKDQRNETKNKKWYFLGKS